MAILDQVTKNHYSLINGDCVEAMKDLPANSIGLSIYSPPYGGLYQYSSSEEDLSNSLNYKQFFEHYDFVVKELYRLTVPGRMTCVECMDVPKAGVGEGSEGYIDFPGDIIRQHQRLGFKYWARFAIWKEPLRQAIRTRSKGLRHSQIVKDSSFCNNAGANFVVVLRKPGQSKEPIRHPEGLQKYCGEREIPRDLDVKFKNWKDHKTNKRAHWIWQQYASAFWDDIRTNHVLPYREARESEEEKHCHPMMLDVIERLVQLWSNPNDIVLTPFMGVGSEVYGAIINGRRGIGIELKASYFRQAIKNMALADVDHEQETLLFDDPLADHPLVNNHFQGSGDRSRRRV
jgi:DNA modification methylase